MSAVAIAPLRHAVINVVCLGAKAKMIGTNTVANITQVQDNHTFRDWAVVDFPRQAVNRDGTPAVSWDFDNAITGPGAPSSPQPTTIRLLNLCPKSLAGRDAQFVPAQVSQRLTLDNSFVAIGALRNGRQLSATAMTVTVWDFVRGIIEGHSDLHSRCVKCPDVDALRAQLIGVHPL